MEKIPFTQVGLDRLKEELNSLKHTERQAVIKQLRKPASMVICLKMLNTMLLVNGSPLLRAG